MVKLAKQVILIVLLGCLLPACTPPAEPVSVTRPVVAVTDVANTAVPPTNTPTPLPTNTAVSSAVATAETAGRPLEPGIEATATPRPPHQPNPTAEAPAAIPRRKLPSAWQMVWTGRPFGAWMVFRCGRCLVSSMVLEKPATVSLARIAG